MKAITIYEPWAWAIVDASLISEGWKRIENRQEGFPAFRGPLLIHSGKGKNYMPRWKDCCYTIRSMVGSNPPPFYEIVGRGLIGLADVAATVHCDRLKDVRAGMSLADKFGLDYPILLHWIEGPVCLCLRSIVPFAKPIPFRGQQGIFDVPDQLVDGAIETANERAAIRQFGGG